MLPKKDHNNNYGKWCMKQLFCQSNRQNNRILVGPQYLTTFM